MIRTPLPFSASRYALRIVSLSLCCAVAPHASAQTPAPKPSPAPKHGMGIDDLVRLVRVGSPQVSPDGAWVAYTVTSVNLADDKNKTDLWMISWDGTQDLQLTRGKESAGNPRWSPDGRYLAFTSDREGESKGTQVWVLDRRGGDAQQLTNVKENLDDYRWSPDSKQLLLTITKRDQPEPEKDAKPKPPKPIVIDRYHFKQDRQGYLTDNRSHLFLFEIAGKTLSKLTSNPVTGGTAFEEEAAEWSPDGRQIAFVSNQTPPDPDRFNNPDVFVTAASPGSPPRKLTTWTGADEPPLRWTPDGTRILYRQGITPHYAIYDMPQLAAVTVADAKVTLLAPGLDQWVGAPVLSGRDHHILTEVQDDRNQPVYSIPLDGRGSPQRLTETAGEAMGLNEAAGHTALLWTDDSNAAEIYALEGKQLRKLTHHNDALLNTLDLATTQDLATTTSDRNNVHGLLTLPVGYTAGKVPLLLFIHGGPTSQDAHGFSPERQLFAAHGYAMLNVNYRGSTGRGHAYSEAINADWGDKEVIDLLAMVDAAVATGKIDPEKIVIAGWSYGGILTDHTIASTVRFKAASSGAGMGNLLGFYGIDQYILQYENELTPPWKNLDLYVKLSYPFLHADRIKTPTLFMGGDKDFNVPVQGGEQMYQALRSVGTPAELIVYPGEFHGFTRPSFIRDRYQRWFDWYDHYALGKPLAAAKD